MADRPRARMSASVRDWAETMMTDGERKRYAKREDGTWHGLPIVRFTLRSGEYEFFTTMEADNCDELLGDGSGPCGGCTGMMNMRRLICRHFGLEEAY